MCSSALLIRHLHLAIEYRLVPENTHWLSFSRSIVPFRHLDDDEVSSRYHFGQLRLTQLNWAIRVLRPQSSKNWWYYHEVYWNTGAYIERFFAPLLFLFGYVPIILTAMQIMVTVPEGEIVAAMQWATAAKASWGFSLAMILFIATLWFFFLGGIMAFLMAQFTYGALTRRRKNRLRRNQSELRIGK